MSMAQEPDAGVAAETRRVQWIMPIAVSLVLVALTTAALWIIEADLDRQHLIFVYFVPAAYVAIRYGSLSAMAATIASSIAAAIFLYPPKFSFLIESPLDILELALFCLLALLASQVVSGFASDREIARRRRRALGGDGVLGKLTAWPARLGRGRG